ncbi:hypothetical protein [Desulforamulus aquiferis]|uniref:Uncharacterized protein n=1 Tax=Desulforamulus aquiferis TaxID=1397668 RepID=A0AAW7ZFX7_9FIRM|nr:hypothetical protein [Desulforamulus aquiferis]MDO7788296.1 hypothetical protein [Desulforamulus aquiferis]
MTTIIACSIACFSTAAFIALWFWVVRKELKAKQNIIESARSQLAASRKQRLRAKDTPETEKAQEILDRSHDIYRQSVELYNDTMFYWAGEVWDYPSSESTHTITRR